MEFGGVGLYVNNSVEAVELYKEAFGVELGYHVLNEDGSFYHSDLSRDGNYFFSVVESKELVSRRNPVQIGITCKDRDELQHAFACLAREGEISMEIRELPWSPCAAEVADKFGVRWYLSVPQHRPPDDFERV